MPGQLPVASVKEFVYLIDLETARRIALHPPLEALEIAETVHRGTVRRLGTRHKNG